MASKRNAFWLPGYRIPQPDCAVFSAAGEKYPSIGERDACNRMYGAGMPVQPTLNGNTTISYFINLDGVVIARRGDELPRSWKSNCGNGMYGTRMSGQQFGRLVIV
jgi:hypothetical protein